MRRVTRLTGWMFAGSAVLTGGFAVVASHADASGSAAETAADEEPDPASSVPQTTEVATTSTIPAFEVPTTIPAFQPAETAPPVTEPPTTAAATTAAPQPAPTAPAAPKKKHHDGGTTGGS